MYQLLSDLKDCIQTCFDPSGDCNYAYFVSLGIPPADCSSIAVWLDSSRRNRSDNSECCTNIYDTNINVTITRCCMTTDADIEFNPTKEEQDAACFLDDLCKLRDCLSCGGCDLSSYAMGCGLVVDDVRLDQEKMGMCYSATIALKITEDCCGGTP